MKNPLTDNPKVEEALDALAAAITEETAAGRCDIKHWSFFVLTDSGQCATAQAGCMCKYCRAIVAMSAARKAGNGMADAIMPAMDALLETDRQVVH